MKTQRFNKKLTLNKETLTNLDNSKMKGVNGGISLICDTEPESYCFKTECHTICSTECLVCFP